MGVLVGGPATAREGRRLTQYSVQVVQIKTGKAFPLEANQVRQALAPGDLEALDVLVLENVGDLSCPVGFDLGPDVKVGMCSASEGDDKAATHQSIVQASAALRLN